MDQKTALRTAKQRLEKQAATIEEQKEKLAQAERRQQAEEIVEMKIASGTLDPADFLDERDRLVNSDTDLQQTKTAMQEAGPGFTTGSLVDIGEEDANEKEASSEDNSSDHVKAAKQDLSSTMGELGLD